MWFLSGFIPLLFLAIPPVIHAQNPSTNMQIPPLQWINLSRLIKGGSSPFPVKDSAMVYDPEKRVLVIFGGESAAGTPVQNTWILELDTLTWRSPVPPDAQRDIPPARAAAVSGTDFASNLRSGLLLFGGKGGSGSTPLNDVWYYSFQNEFWAQVSIEGQGPSPRWNSAGGTAPRSSIQNVETYMWAVGGRNATHGLAFDEVWELNVSGTMAAGVNGAKGVWSRVPTLPMSGPQTPRIGLAGTVIPPRGNTDREGSLAIFGGCDSVDGATYNSTCARQDAYILTLPTSSGQTQAQWTQASNCSAGMYAAALAPNRNTAASAFAPQVFLLPGAVDPQVWGSGPDPKQGEVGILMANSGVWARVLPAGDPGSTPSYPSAKEGATVYSHLANIAGGTSNWSDTVVFGGKDATTGELTNEIWLLRAYNDIIDASGKEWSGYGDGQLQSGLVADGRGVKVEFLSQCATRLKVDQPPTPTNTKTPSPTNTNAPPVPSIYSSLFDSSPVHPVLSPVSIALLFLATLISRYSSGPASTPSQQPHVTLFYTAVLIGVIGYGLGIAGFAVSAAPEGPSTLERRAEQTSTTSFLGTSHSRAAFVLFVMLYGVLGVYAFLLLCLHAIRKGLFGIRTTLGGIAPHKSPLSDGGGITPPEKSSPGSDGLVIGLGRRRRPRSGSVESQRFGVDESDSDEVGPPSQPHSRSKSHGGILEGGFFAAASATLYRKRRKSSGTIASAPPSSFSPPRFEVTNRPRRPSQPGSHAYPPAPNQNGGHVPRNLSDISWLARRRSLNAIGDLDYALSTGAISPPLPSSNPLVAPSTIAAASTSTPIRLTIPPQTPSTSRLFFNILLQIAFLYASTFWLVTYHLADSTVGLVVTALIVTAYYSGLLVLAWIGRPRRSLLVVIVSRLRSSPTTMLSPAEPSSSPLPPSTVALSHPHPYYHQPNYRVTNEGEDLASRLSPHGRARSADSDPLDDDDENDDERQARMEEEMARRDVSIFTVPKRKLVVRNE